MTISFPLSLPATRVPARIDFRREVNIGEAESQFSFVPQNYIWNADRWLATLTWGEMVLADADDVEAFIVAMNGREGSVLVGDPMRPAPRGTWAGQSPLVNGASQTGKTLAIDGMTAASTGKAGDWFQLGSGSTARIYKLTAPFTANGSGQVTIDFWPRLRVSPADNAPLTLASAKGLFKLANNIDGWTVGPDRDSGISLELVEDLRGL